MGRKSKAELAEILLALVPLDGSAVGNQSVRQDLSERLGRDVSEDEYDALKAILLERGDLLRGQGRGGSVRRAQPSAEPFGLAQTRVEDSAPAPKRMAKAKLGARRVAAETPQILPYRYDDKRKNNPEVGMVDRMQRCEGTSLRPWVAGEQKTTE